MKMSSILVTGGAGYLGAVLIPQLLVKGYQVTVIDNFRHGVPSLITSCGNPNLTLINGDARDQHVISKPLTQADAIIPLAAVVGATACDRDQQAAITTNFQAIRMLRLKASREQLILYPNTNSGYGSSSIAECTEDTPLNPISIYGRTKVEAEEIVLEHLNAISFRFATLFGASPRMRLDLLVNHFVLRAVRDRSIVLFEPHFRRNFLHIRDAANAFIFAITNCEQMTRQAYNVGLSSANLTKAQLCECIKQHVKDFTWYVGAGEDQDKRDYLVSNAKIEALGWIPQYTLDDGIQELVKAYNMPFDRTNFTNS